MAPPKPCADCLKEDRQAPNARKYNSYCREHAYKRQRTSKRQRTVRREYIMGFWSQIAPSVAVKIQQNVADLAEPPLLPIPPQRTRPLQGGQYMNWLRELPRQFEHALCLAALNFGRQLTQDEEAEYAAQFYGTTQTTADPSSTDAQSNVMPVTTLLMQILTDAAQGIEHTAAELWLGGRNPDGIRLLLPDPVTRKHHRADGLGGPTTEGEPSYLEYLLLSGQEPDEEVTNTYNLLLARQRGAENVTIEEYQQLHTATSAVLGNVTVCKEANAAAVRVRNNVQGLLGHPVTDEQSSQLKQLAMRMYAQSPYSMDEATQDVTLHARIALAADDQGIIELPKVQPGTQVVEITSFDQLEDAQAGRLAPTTYMAPEPSDIALVDDEEDEGSEVQIRDEDVLHGHWGPPEE